MTQSTIFGPRIEFNVPTPVSVSPDRARRTLLAAAPLTSCRSKIVPTNSSISAAPQSLRASRPHSASAAWCRLPSFGQAI